MVTLLDGKQSWTENKLAQIQADSDTLKMVTIRPNLS